MTELLRETFEEYARRAPDAGGLRAGVDERVRALRTRRRWGAVAGAAATAAAVVAGVALVAGPGGDGTPPAAPNRLVTEPPAPPGARRVLWHGLAVTIPERLFTQGFDVCGSPIGDAVIVNDIPVEGQCARRARADATLVHLVPPTAYYFESLRTSRIRNVTLGGVPARRVTGRTVDGLWAEWLVVPTLDAAVLVTEPERAVAKAVLDSVRVAEGRTDERGCAVRAESVYATTPPARPGATERMVPDRPVQASVCRYDPSGLVIVSKLVGAAEAAELARVMNIQPRGFSPVEDEFGRHWSIVTFRYETGPEVAVWVHLGGVRDNGISNGAVTGPAAFEVGNALKPYVGWRYTYEQDRIG